MNSLAGLGAGAKLDNTKFLDNINHGQTPS